MDWTGKKFGKLTPIKRMTEFQKATRYECVCDCGNVTMVRSHNLTSGHTKSCGCIGSQNSALTGFNSSYRHGQSRTKEYKAWISMKSRCYDANYENFASYGGRGIKVCERWLNSFENFLADMGLKPNENYSLDRIEVNENYEPLNCRWATEKEQSFNKRNTKNFME